MCDFVVFRCDWMPIVLQLKALGIDQLIHFQFPSRPPVLHIRQAMDTLNALGALDDTTAGRLTVPTGELMAILPIDPRLTKSASRCFRLLPRLDCLLQTCNAHSVFMLFSLLFI